MAFHSGPEYRNDDVSIGVPAREILLCLSPDADVAHSVDHWISQARQREDNYYFSLFWKQKCVGQILLHDMNLQTGEALVAYHLFERCYRNHGVGTKALHLLQQYAREETTLQVLTIITSLDNIPSQRLAQKTGFAMVGAPREDPSQGIVFQWHIYRPSEKDMREESSPWIPKDINRG